jgi:hypothetical protein
MFAARLQELDAENRSFFKESNACAWGSPNEAKRDRALRSGK